MLESVYYRTKTEYTWRCCGETGIGSTGGHMVKVVLIGAGSTSFSPSVLASMVQTPELAGATLALVDIDPDILNILASVAERVVKETGADLRIEATTDRREVLPGADFVIATFAA